MDDERQEHLKQEQRRRELEAEYKRSGYWPQPEADLEFADTERAGAAIRRAWMDYIEIAAETFWTTGGADGTGQTD